MIQALTNKLTLKRPEKEFFPFHPRHQRAIRIISRDNSQQGITRIGGKYPCLGKRAAEPPKHIGKVVRSALRVLEERKTKLEALRAHLAEGAAQATRGEFAQNYSLDKLIADADAGE